jgi:hypothetical protein
MDRDLGVDEDGRGSEAPTARRGLPLPRAARADHSPRAAAPVVVGDVRIEEGDNRVRVLFPSKPDEAVRTSLKRGVRWSPRAGAWQRQASVAAWMEARRIVEHSGRRRRRRADEGATPRMGQR